MTTPSLWNTGSATSSVAEQATTLTLADIQFAQAKMNVMLSVLPDTDPLERWMTRKGFDPKKGGILIWPASVPVDWGGFPPSYVRISRLLSEPLLTNSSLLVNKTSILKSGMMA